MDRAQLLDWARQQYGTEPERLWEKHPGYEVLRNSAGKWYAVVMEIPRSKLGLPGEGDADIVNLKCGAALVDTLLTRPGFLRAWHMNKESWVSALLDGTAEDDELRDLLALSYHLTMPKRRKKPADSASDAARPLSSEQEAQI